MPTFVITAPDGKEYEVDAPEGATQAQALERVKNQYSTQNKQPPQAPVKEPSMMDYAHQVGSGLAKAGTDLIDAPFAIGNMITQGTQDLMGIAPEDRPIGRSMLPSQMPAIKDFVAGGTARKIPKGQSDLADALRTGSEWGAGLLANPAKKLPDILMGGGAALGEYIGDETGEVVGGLTGLLSGVKRANKIPKVADSSIDEKAINFITENADDSNQAIANLRDALARGEKGSLAELTKDAGIFNVESATQKGSKMTRELDALTQQRGQQIVEDISGGTLDPSTAPKIASERKTQLMEPVLERKDFDLNQGFADADALADFERQLPKAQKELTEAETRLQQANTDIAPTQKPSEASTELSSEYKRLEDEFRTDIEKPAWDEFSGGQKLDVNEVIAAPMAKLDDMTPTEIKILEGNFKKEFDLIRNWSKDKNTLVEPDEVHAVISQIKAIRANAKANNNADFSHKLLGDVQNSLETSLKELGDGRLYDNAVSATKLKNERFKPSRVGKERGKFEPETLASRLLDRNEGGAVVGDLIKAADSPEITKAAEGYIKSIAKRDGVDDAFLGNYDELLDRFPELKTQLNSAKKAQDDLAKAEKNIDVAMSTDNAAVAKLPRAIEQAKAKVVADADKTQKGLTKSVGNLQINKFKNDSKGFLDKALTGDAEDLTKLNRQMGRTKGGQEALKAAVKERIVNKITKTKDGQVTVPFNAIDEFLKTKDNLVKSGILSADEVADIEKILDRATISGLRKKGAVQKLDQADDTLSDVLSSGAAIAALGMLPASNQLMLAGTVKRIFKKKLNNQVVNKDVIEALNDMILNPKRFLKGVGDRKITTEAEMEKYISSYINAFSQSVAEDKE